MSNALARIDSEQSSSIDMSAIDVFSHVSKEDKLKTHKGDHYSLVGYEPMSIEEGSIERAKALVSQGKTRHLFNDHAILKVLVREQTLENNAAEQEGREPQAVFDILSVSTRGRVSKRPEGYFFIARHNKPA